MIQKIIFALFMFLFTACSADQYTYFKNSIGSDITSSSIVTTIRPEIIDDDDGVPVGIGFQDNCNAFYVRNVDNSAYLVTAAHCVNGYEIGSDFVFIGANGVGGQKAKIVSLDPVRDLAFAKTSSSLIALNLNLDYKPQPGDTALIASSLYRKLSVGYVVEELSYGWISVNNTITKGWSGSPVMNGNGDVWGVVSKCSWDEENKSCVPGKTTVTRLYR